MQFAYHFPFLIILLPMLASLMMPLCRNVSLARRVTWGVQAIMIVLAAGLLSYLSSGSQEYFLYSLGKTTSPWVNELRAGMLEAVLSLSFSLVMLFSLTGGVRGLNNDLDDSKANIYYLMINLLSASMMAMVFTNDLFTAYVFIEINTIAACAIAVAKQSGETLKAAVKYLVMSVLGSGLFLLSTSLLYGLTGHLLMEPIQASVAGLIQTGKYHVPLLVTLALFAVSISVKGALFPLHTWLPDAHAYATTTSSAVLSSLVVKGYIVLFIKILYRVYGIEAVSAIGVLPILFLLGLASMIVGSIMAFRQKNIKRMIAYSSVAQIGYIFLGIGLNTTAGFTAACYQIIAHAFTKCMLFIAAGAFIEEAGSKQIADLRGAARKNPIAGLAFGVGALSMIGVPLFAGFVSKFYLASASVQGEYGGWIAMIVLALSTFLNALYYAPSLMQIYSVKKSGEQQDAQPALRMSSKSPAATYTLLMLMAANLLLGIFYQPVLTAIEAGILWLS